MSLQVIGPQLAQDRVQFLAATVGCAFTTGVVLMAVFHDMCFAALVGLMISAVCATINLQIMVHAINHGTKCKNTGQELTIRSLRHFRRGRHDGWACDRRSNGTLPTPCVQPIIWQLLRGRKIHTLRDQSYTLFVNITMKIHTRRRLPCRTSEFLPGSKTTCRLASSTSAIPRQVSA